MVDARARLERLPAGAESTGSYPPPAELLCHFGGNHLVIGQAQDTHTMGTGLRYSELAARPQALPLGSPEFR